MVPPMRLESEMIDQGGMYHFNHQVFPIPRSFNVSDVRNRLAISSPTMELGREWEEPIGLVMTDPRLALGGRQ